MRAPPPHRKTPAAQVIHQPGLLQILRDDHKYFLQPHRHDPLQMLQIDCLERQAKVVRDGNGPALERFIHERRAVFEFQLFRATQLHLQAVAEVVGNMVAANRQDAGVLDDAVGITM